MKIYCSKCGKYLGMIKEGSTLRKGIIFICKDCYTKCEPPLNPKEDFIDYFNRIMNGKN